MYIKAARCMHAWQQKDMWLQSVNTSFRIAAFPAQIQDARNAIRFMKRNGQSWHADVKNIFIGGCSSGGHTAVFAGMLKENDPMNASIIGHRCFCERNP